MNDLIDSKYVSERCTWKPYEIENTEDTYLWNFGFSKISKGNYVGIKSKIRINNVAYKMKVISWGGDRYEVRISIIEPIFNSTAIVKYCDSMQDGLKWLYNKIIDHHNSKILDKQKQAEMLEIANNSKSVEDEV